MLIESGPGRHWSRTWAVVLGVTALLGAAELVYSQTMACVVDEGYHLLAAQLILWGQRPYLDFVFPQTPLNAYWNAGWMGILGPTWRPIHLSPRSRPWPRCISPRTSYCAFPVRRWRLAAGLTTVLVFGLNDAVFKFGAVAQPYGICLLLAAASLRSVVAPWNVIALACRLGGGLRRRGGGEFAVDGAGGAGAVGMAPGVFDAGTPHRDLPSPPAGRWCRSRPACGCCPGTRTGHLRHHRLSTTVSSAGLAGALDHDAGVMFSWVDSGQALILIVLSLVALRFVRSRKDWTRLQRAPFYLCGWMALALAFHISQAHPTFAWYYLLMLPFLGVLAPLGLYALGSKLGYADRPFMALLPVAVLGVLGLAKSVHAEWGYIRWSSYEELAARVDAVSAPQTRIFADEQIYFLTRRMPPEGQEIEDSHKMILPAQKAALLHIVPRADAYRHIKEGYFGTVVMCDDDAINDLDLAHRFSHQESFEDLDCTLFWQLAPLKTATAGAT